MIAKYTYKRLTWMDLDRPTSDEIAKIISDYRLHPVVGEELLREGTTPKIEFYNDYIFLVLHIPVYTGSAIKIHEIDVVLGKEFIITTQYDTLASLQDFSKLFDINPVLDKGALGDHAGFILYHMMKQLYKGIEEYIPTTSLDLIEMKHTIRSHKDILHHLQTIGGQFYGSDFTSYTQDLISGHNRLYELFLSHQERIADIRDTHNAVLFAKQYEAIKTLTLLSFAMFPISLIALLFSMDTMHKPIVGARYDFEIIVGLMILILGGIFAFFKYKKWL